MESTNEAARGPVTVSCLCPTYRRPSMLENSIALFQQQDYPLDLRELIVLEDAGEIPNQVGEGWQLLSAPERFWCLGDKYNTMAGLSDGDLLLVWEDDDVYLPEHISNYVGSWDAAGRPELAWFITGKPQAWNGTGILSENGWFQHASIGMTKALWRKCGGWPITRARAFDQRLVEQRLVPNGQRLIPEQNTYVFRWETTKHYHGQGWMHPSDPEDAAWWLKAETETKPQPRRKLHPQLDADTQRLFERICARPFTSPDRSPEGISSPMLATQSV